MSISLVTCQLFLHLHLVKGVFPLTVLLDADAARDLGSLKQLCMDRARLNKTLDNLCAGSGSPGHQKIHVHALHSIVSAPDVLPADRDGDRPEIEP